ncbi:MAG: methyltransferase [Omnitrophica bacterium RIFCSPLOWO2_01_FULL_45_10b]|nr:MAG: methyltransferase [Omnitrophica bacterium RIFCSPLOWO2_01_FULL_45_10b]
MKASNNGNGKKDHNIEQAVRERYAQGAKVREEALCCPTNYDPKYLKVIPQEILEKDYGCGDPSRFLKEGDTVLDLGSGGGKICYIASQVVGAQGKVIGVDFNPTMLELARKYEKEIAKRIGWSNVEFRRGRIQDLKTDLEALEQTLKKSPIHSVDDLMHFEDAVDLVKGRTPLVEDESIDVVVSNCVLNLVRSEDKKALFREMHRVLKKGGRVAISDIVSDEFVPEELQKDSELWSGCISGAFQEKEFLKAFEEAGFYGVRVEKLDERPWRIVQGIEFRSMTITAYKGKEGPCWERNQAVIYKGPWKQVVDDDGHILKRGVRTAVCDKTFQIYSKTPYQNEFILVPPTKDVPLSKAKPFDCDRTDERDPRETKGKKYTKPSSMKSVCMDGGCC